MQALNLSSNLKTQDQFKGLIGSDKTTFKTRDKARKAAEKA
jgi:hypothetical protein